ncbi:MAG: hypothetical protein AAFO17_15900 [Pseudomonadota bacterium]
MIYLFIAAALFYSSQISANDSLSYSETISFTDIHWRTTNSFYGGNDTKQYKLWGVEEKDLMVDDVKFLENFQNNQAVMCIIYADSSLSCVVDKRSLNKYISQRFSAEDCEETRGVYGSCGAAEQ